MPVAKDGSKHASHTRARMHDEKEEERKKAPKKEMAPKGEDDEPKTPKSPKGEAGAEHSEPDGDEYGGEDSPESIDDVVATHGPAEEMHHKQVDGMHHVVTHHGGHKHKSTHSDPASVGNHMMAAMGQPQPPQAPPAAGQPPAGGMDMSGGGGGIPGLM